MASYARSIMKSPGLLRKLGPGLFFAAVANGVSHLVKLTRTGALDGIAALIFIARVTGSLRKALRSNRVGWQIDSVMILLNRAAGR